MTATKGLRDRGILAVLLGCGVRRSEVAALTVAHVQQRDGRCCIVDLVGKHGRVRTIPMPTWVEVAQDAWTGNAGVVSGVCGPACQPRRPIAGDAIHLDQAVSYTANIKKLLAAGATTEISPDVYFFRVKKDASEYAENCRFDHTVKGSFGFTIESPVSPNTEPVFPGMERVIQRIARGIRVIQEAVIAQDPGVVAQRFQTGFSANMCEEFAEVQQTAPSGMGFGFLLSPEWPTPPISELWVGPQHVEMSQVAAKRMREQAPMQPMEISGRIIRLQNEADPQDLLDETHEREVVIYWKSDEFGGMNVRLSLGPPEYLAAVKGHLRGQVAKATGRLEKRGRFWWLADMTTFSV